jgi:hypothetical protein
MRLQSKKVSHYKNVETENEQNVEKKEEKKRVKQEMTFLNSKAA